MILIKFLVCLFPRLVNSDTQSLNLLLQFILGKKSLLFIHVSIPISPKIIKVKFLFLICNENSRMIQIFLYNKLYKVIYFLRENMTIFFSKNVFSIFSVFILFIPTAHSQYCVLCEGHTYLS